MPRYTTLLVIFSILFFSSLRSNAQTYYDSLRVQLDSLTQEFPGFEERVDFGVSGVSVREFLRSLSENHDLNFSISNDIDGKIVNNFTNAKVSDVVFFICKEHHLGIDIYGSILSFYKMREPKPILRKPVVDYNKLNNFLSLDLKNDSISKTVSAITEITGINLLYAPSLEGKKLNAFIKNRPLENALELLAEANDIELDKKSDRVYFFKSTTGQIDKKAIVEQKHKNQQVDHQSIDELIVDDNNFITVRVKDANINDLLYDAALKTNNRYFLYSDLQGKISTYIDNVDFDEFMDYLFSGTEYTSIYEEGVYFIGKRSQEILRTTELVKLEHRTIESVLDFIPSEMKKGVEIKEFIELNGLVLSGSRPNIREIKQFLASIDQVVPVVKIDVIIVDVTKSSEINAGIDLSIGGDNVPAASSGTVNPGLDMTLNSTSINDLINSFNGLGLVNLGKVSSDFFANIQALESNGYLNLRSTPMLATLNGHEAELKIGNTEYYLELQSNTVTSQTPIQTQSQTYKSVTADLTVSIKPIVSSGDNVTLEIEVNQSDFTARIDETAPPGTVDRSFKSYIRVKNGEMILLGGLEEKRKEDSGSGFPILSRIPIIKWLFSSRSKSKDNSKLNIFIRPTVIYG